MMKKNSERNAAIRFMKKLLPVGGIKKIIY